MRAHKVALAVQFIQDREVRLSALAIQSAFLSASLHVIAALITLTKLVHGIDPRRLSAKTLILSEC